jgi:tetratricopeptide (TPR) repeat protein
MTIFDFSCAYYFRDHYDIIVMIEYLKKINNLTQKEINEKADIPKSNFRRAQLKGFLGAGDMLEKMAAYLNIQTEIDPAIIAEFDDTFSQFYTSVCFSKINDFKKYYVSSTEKLSNYKNSILMIQYYLMQLIYFVSEVNYTNIINYEKLDEAIDFLQHFVDKMSNEHRFLYYEYMSCYYGFKKDPEKVVHFARLTVYLSANYPDFEPTANYHISFAYSMISDFINALIYANKALPKLEEQLNYNKAVYCRMIIATIYKKLGNIDEAKALLRKNLVYMTFTEVQRNTQVTYLNYADCLLIEKNYAEALKYYTLIERDFLKQPEYEAIMVAYCMYQLKQTETANAYIAGLEQLHADEKFSAAYLSLIQFFRAYFNRVAIPEIEAAFKTAEGYMDAYKFRAQYMQDLARDMIEELRNHRAPKQPKLLSDDPYML